MRHSAVQTMATTDYSISTLPANVEAERSILGAVLLDNLAYNQAAEHLARRFFPRLAPAHLFPHGRSGRILPAHRHDHADRGTRAEEGFAGRRRRRLHIRLVDGVPDRPRIEHYVRIVRDKAMLRGLISRRQHRHRPGQRAIRSCRRNSQRRRSGHLPALGKAHRTRLHRRAGDRPRSRSDRSMPCCNAASASPASRLTTPSWTK